MEKNNLAVVKFEIGNPPNTTVTAAVRDEWKWQVIYARCFTLPPPFSSSSSSTLIPVKPNLYKPTWISSSGFSTLSLHLPADGLSSTDSIITVSLQGTVIEEHFTSNLNFTWPQVSCMSGFPARGSLAVFASYKDSADEKHKFALRFSTISETEDFINSLQDILTDKLPNKLPLLDVISAISSQSDFVPPYRPDISNIRSPKCASSPAANLLNEDPEESLAIDRGAADIESNILAFPPRFSSLVSSCSAEVDNGNLALAPSVPNESKDFDLKFQIAKYMQDASFIDMVDKVNDVIRELGDDFVL